MGVESGAIPVEQSASGSEINVETLDSNTPEAQLAMLKGPVFLKESADFRQFLDSLSHAFERMHNKLGEQSVWDQRLRDVAQKGKIPDPTDNEWDPSSPDHSSPRTIDARAVWQMAEQAKNRSATDSAEGSMLLQGAEGFNSTFDKYKLDFNFHREVENAVRVGNASEVLWNSFEKARKAKTFELMETTEQAK